MLHICRDFLAKHPTNVSPSHVFYGVYLVSLFLRGVLGYSVVGNTGFNLDGAAITKGSGTNNANINLGGTLSRAVQLPGSYVVSVADVDRILVLKSNLNPKFNSGLFRVTAFDSATNSLLLLSRPWLEIPPAETNVSWSLYETEAVVTNNFSIAGNGAANPHYRGSGTATCTRIILQSPHSLGWQVRLCCETTIDFTTAQSVSAATHAPGFGGNSAGDFQIAGNHLHPAQWFDLSDTAANAKTLNFGPGMANNLGTPLLRYFMWGDDVTGTVVLIARSHSSTVNEFLSSFGLPEDEELPLPNAPIKRLFVYGSTSLNGGGTISVKALDSPQVGVAFGDANQPVTCIPSSWCYLAGAGANQNIMLDTAAGDNVYMQASELYCWDLLAGTLDTRTASHPPDLVGEPRRMGRFPIARHGRENYNRFSTSVDAGKTYLYTDQGVYLPWSGSIVP